MSEEEPDLLERNETLDGYWFSIERTSDWSEHPKPLDDDRVVKKKIETGSGGQVERWFIHLSSLDELIDLRKDLGNDNLILRRNFYTDNFFSLEIYDDYRE